MKFSNPHITVVRRPGTTARGYWWVAKYSGELIACDIILRRKVDVDDLNEIRLEAVRRPSADTFETRIRKGRYDGAYFIEFPATTLVYDLSKWMAVQHRAGRKYIRVTYRPTKKRP
jgi:hypothetical protein